MKRQIGKRAKDTEDRDFHNCQIEDREGKKILGRIHLPPRFSGLRIPYTVEPGSIDSRRRAMVNHNQAQYASSENLLQAWGLEIKKTLPDNTGWVTSLWSSRTGFDLLLEINTPYNDTAIVLNPQQTADRIGYSVGLRITPVIIR